MRYVKIRVQLRSLVHLSDGNLSWGQGTAQWQFKHISMMSCLPCSTPGEGTLSQGPQGEPGMREWSPAASPLVAAVM